MSRSGLFLTLCFFTLVPKLGSSAAPWYWSAKDAAAALANWEGRRQLRGGVEEETSHGEGPLLVPLLPYGLSNQIIALKEALSLAAVLNWTVVGYGFMPHYSEYAAAAAAAAAGGSASGVEPTVEAPAGAVQSTAIPFDTLIDRASLSPLVRIITVREAVAALRGGHGHGRRDAHEAGAEGADAGGTRARGDSARRHKHRRLASGGGGLASASALAQTAGCSSGGGDDEGEGGASTAGGGYCLPVDRLVLLRDNGMPDTLRKAEAGGRLDASRAHTLRKKFNCDARGLDWFRMTAARERWQVVALNGYRCVLPQARHGFAAMQLRAGGDSGCWQAYQRVTALMQRSEAVRDAAAAFLDSAAARALVPVDTADGGGSRAAVSGAGTPLSLRVLALHFRPYPDTCLDYFVNMTTFELGAAQEVCSQPLLLHRTVPLVQAFLALWAAEAAEVAEAEEAAAVRGPAVVFVMSHPKVRKTVSREFERLWATAGAGAATQEEEEGAGDSGRNSARKETQSERGGGRSLHQLSELIPLPRLSFLDLDDVPPALFEAPGSGSSTRGSSRALPVGANSILSVVEQQVCAGADVFIGTAASSISVLVAQERVVQRQPGTQAGAGVAGEDEGGEAREEKEEWVKQVVEAATEGEGAQGFHVASAGHVTILL